MKYWIRSNKETLGPLGVDEIQKVNGISENSLVCPVGATAASDWRKLREVPELVQALRRASEPPPLPPEELAPLPVSQREQSIRTQASSAKPSSRAAMGFAIAIVILTTCLIPEFCLLIAYGTLSPCGALAQELPRMSLEAMGMSSAQVKIVLAFNSASGAEGSPLINSLGQAKCTEMLVQYKLGENPFNGILSKQRQTQ